MSELYFPTHEELAQYHVGSFEYRASVANAHLEEVEDELVELYAEMFSEE